MTAQAQLAQLVESNVSALGVTGESLASVQLGVSTAFDTLQNAGYCVIAPAVGETQERDVVFNGVAGDGLFSSQLFAQISTEAPAAE